MLTRRLAGLALVSLGLAACASPEPVKTKTLETTGRRVLTRDDQAAITPAEALQRLMDGNHRFVTGHSIRRDLPREAQASAEGQYPFAAIVSCVDSRVSPELLFDQGLGDIFSARVLRDQSPILRELVESGALKVVGGFQDLSSGRVLILE